MVVDTSAVNAFLRSEPESDRFEELLLQARELSMSALNAFECRVVLHVRFGPEAAADFELFLARADIIVEPFDATQAELAFSAYRKYGKGSGHPARLNLGDCAAYALAKSKDRALLFKGDDFGHTDVESAAASARAE